MREKVAGYSLLALFLPVLVLSGFSSDLEDSCYLSVLGNSSGYVVGVECGGTCGDDSQTCQCDACNVTIQFTNISCNTDESESGGKTYVNCLCKEQKVCPECGHMQYYNKNASTTGKCNGAASKLTTQNWNFGLVSCQGTCSPSLTCKDGYPVIPPEQGGDGLQRSGLCSGTYRWCKCE